MLTFQLFRIKVFPPIQQHLFDGERTRSEILREAIHSLQNAIFRGKSTWHVGNVRSIDENALYFRLGRSKIATLEIFDEEKGGFVDQKFETAPYTHAIVDIDLEICAIAEKPSLSPSTAGIARRFERLLNEYASGSEFHATFEIEELKDPEDFITHIRKAYSISKFWVQFSRPNATDADADYIKPFQKWLEASNGEKGKAEIKGENLNSEVVEAVARSAAATGDNAGAWFKPETDIKAVKKQLKGSSVNISYDDKIDDTLWTTFIARVRNTYRKIRGDGPNS